jgi:CDP-paratose 2-epimerase
MNLSIIITGGAGFIGSSLAVYFKENHRCQVTCFDNLKRRGSELALSRLKRHDVGFVHGDVRQRSDLDELPAADVLIECSAEPSVLAGYKGAPHYLVDTNLLGAVNCYELARRTGAAVIFLSTSRVYPYEPLGRLPLARGRTRFEWQGEPSPHAGPAGIKESFPLSGPRSLYGATKLAAELLLQEYGAMYGLRHVINRCGVITGPWQFGKTDQGVFMYWLLNHYWGRPLRYIGYGGEGMQVRDLVHILDLAELIGLQIDGLQSCNGRIYNVGGGREISLSLRETTDLCRDITGRDVPVEPLDEERPADLPWYITDTSMVQEEMDWQPRRSPSETLRDMFSWAQDHERELREALG